MGVIVLLKSGRAEHVRDAARWERERSYTTTGAYIDGDWILMDSGGRVVARFDQVEVAGVKMAGGESRIPGVREGRQL